jgi:RNA polymerase sigma factor for flagellar operon FliA
VLTGAHVLGSAGHADLLGKGLPIVRRLAFRMARRLPPHVDVDDLISAGNEGLLKAIAAFDPDNSPRFEPYAESRIRGAILDELRALDPMTRHGRRRLGDVTKTIRRLEQELGRPPLEQEVAAALDMSLEDYQRLCGDLARGPALGAVGGVDPDDVESAEEGPLDRIDDAQLRQRLVEAIRRLPERTQTVLALYYQEECTQAEIGQILGVTESRVCQILGESAARIRSYLASDDGPSRSKRRS